MKLPQQMVAIHRSLDAAGVPHAFGGALALAWCTRRARGTIDLDLNLFVEPGRAIEVLSAMPSGVAWTDDSLGAIAREGQARLWWDTTPIDVFFATTDFHHEVAERIRREPFAGDHLPFLSCRDLAVFKAFFGRTRDWADLEEMAAAGTLDVAVVLGVLVDHLGGHDHRVDRLRSLGHAS